MPSKSPGPSPSLRPPVRTETSSPAPRSALRRGAGALGLVLALPLFAVVVGVANLALVFFAGLNGATAVWIGLGITGSYFVARLVKRRGAAGARPAAVLFALSAFAFSAETGADIVLGGYGLSDDVPNPGRALANDALVVAWALATLAWTAGVVVTRRRYRAGQPTVFFATVTGLLMGALLIASWFVTAEFSNVF